MKHLHVHLLFCVNLNTFLATLFTKMAKLLCHGVITCFRNKNISRENSDQVKIFQSILYYMITKSRRKMHDSKVDSATNSTNSERNPITTQDYKKILQKRLYELESESMPAT